MEDSPDRVGIRPSILLEPHAVPESTVVAWGRSRGEHALDRDAQPADRVGGLRSLVGGGAGGHAGIPFWIEVPTWSQQVAAAPCRR